MTALVIVLTGAYDKTDPAFAEFIINNDGAALTSAAMGSVVSWFPWVCCCTSVSASSRCSKAGLSWITECSSTILSTGSTSGSC